ncbi:NAD(P)-binding domain-containing protein [Streptomyces sp. NPDC052051]|uniref:NAD(P)-binding domain-containing protein n=1 Tax=Streptomyces sp. NPDC052051 TaxID=3154649 RepID=UPI003415EA77
MGSIGVIGAGAVGKTVAAPLVASALPGRLLVASRLLDQAHTLVSDLDAMRQATGSPVRPEACEVADLADCEAVVVAVRSAFTNTHTTDVRMGGATANTPPSVPSQPPSAATWGPCSWSPTRST